MSRQQSSFNRATKDEFLRLLREINVDRSGGQRKPHKPLLLLIALAHLVRYRETQLRFAEVEPVLRSLLEVYAPPVKGQPQPELPYWHLQTDDLWSVDGAAQLPRNAKGFPTMAAVRASSAGIAERFVGPLLADEGLIKAAVRCLLDEHFEPSMHDDVLQSVGLDPEWLAGTLSPQLPGKVRETGPGRDSSFRDAVLAAYDQRCAATEFQALLGGSLFGLEAAHVQWHSKGGPGLVTNGIALNPTMHKLFDHGAWSLTDDRKILVSSAFSGSDVAIGMLRSLHGRPLRPPVRTAQLVSVEFIRWHREADLGGVFRQPALG